MPSSADACRSTRTRTSLRACGITLPAAVLGPSRPSSHEGSVGGMASLHRGERDVSRAGLDQPPSVVEVVSGDRETEAPMDDVESNIPIRPVSAPLLRGFHKLGVPRVDRFARVRGLVEVDGDIDRMGWKVGTSLFTEGQREGALGLPPDKMFEDALGGRFGRASTGVGASPSDRGVPARGPEDQIGRSTKERRGEPSLRETGGEEGKQPGQCLPPYFPIGQDPRGRSPPAQAWVFLFGPVSLPGRKPGSAATGVHNLASRSLTLHSRSPVECSRTGCRVSEGARRVLPEDFLRRPRCRAR